MMMHISVFILILILTEPCHGALVVGSQDQHQSAAAASSESCGASSEDVASSSSSSCSASFGSGDADAKHKKASTSSSPLSNTNSFMNAVGALTARLTSSGLAVLKKYTVSNSYFSSGFGPNAFVRRDACTRVRAYTNKAIKAQDLATLALTDAVCEHIAGLADEDDHAQAHYDATISAGNKPLVLSVHGAPGVGKSLFHYALARALYNATTPGEEVPQAPPCPGIGCPAYRVVYGTRFSDAERPRALTKLRASLLAHAMHYPESVLVVEEYDKMDCATRALVRRLVAPSVARAAGMSSSSSSSSSHPQGGAMSSVLRAHAGGDAAADDDALASAQPHALFSRSIVVLESNAGYLDMADILNTDETRKLGADAVFDAMSRTLKDAVYARWEADGCEDAVDTLRTVSAVDHYVPFAPMELRNLVPVAALRLEEKRAAYIRRRVCELTWAERRQSRSQVVDQSPAAANSAVLHFLASKVDYDGPYAIEGAKEVTSVVNKHVARALRAAENALEARRAAMRKAAAAASSPSTTRGRSASDDANAATLAKLGVKIDNQASANDHDDDDDPLPVVELRVAMVAARDSTGTPTGRKVPVLEAIVK
ncbi:torsin [Pseudoscourfieldia marina]